MRPNRQHRKPPDIDRAGNSDHDVNAGFGSSGFRAGHLFTCGIRRRAAAVAAAAQPRQLGRHRDPVLHRLAPFLAHRVGSRKSRWASSPTSEVTALPSPAVASVSVILLLLVSVWRVAAHPGPDDEGSGIRLLPGLGVLRVAGHHRTRSFRCASRSSTNRATATFPECGRSSRLPRWRG